MSTAENKIDTGSFWRRQFAPVATSRQFVFDVLMGICLPLVCLYFDPIVFRSLSGEALLGRYTTLALVAILLGLLSLTVWLSIRRPPALLAGLLAGGAVFSCLLGLVLLPFSLMGLLWLIGVLGFAPFLTGFVFLRNSVRAWQMAGSTSRSLWRPILMAAGLLAACCGPWTAHWYLNREVDRAIALARSQDPGQALTGINSLHWFRGLLSLDAILKAYDEEPDPVVRDRLAGLYKELTGEEIEFQLDRLRD